MVVVLASSRAHADCAAAGCTAQQHASRRAGHARRGDARRGRRAPAAAVRAIRVRAPPAPLLGVPGLWAPPLLGVGGVARGRRVGSAGRGTGRRGRGGVGRWRLPRAVTRPHARRANRAPDRPPRPRPPRPLGTLHAAGRAPLSRRPRSGRARARGAAASAHSRSGSTPTPPPGARRPPPAGVWDAEARLSRPLRPAGRCAHQAGETGPLDRGPRAWAVRWLVYGETFVPAYRLDGRTRTAKRAATGKPPGALFSSRPARPKAAPASGASPTINC
jgi:hypothetical protein